MANEEASYEVVHKHKDYEIRLYQDRLIIQTVMDEESGAFQKLFCICSENFRQIRT